jgi:hypothetical protein
VEEVRTAPEKYWLFYSKISSGARDPYSLSKSSLSKILSLNEITSQIQNLETQRKGVSGGIWNC